jgi:hypothetical protein
MAVRVFVLALYAYLANNALAVVDFGECTFETDFCQWRPTGGKPTLSWERSSTDVLFYSFAFLPSFTSGMAAIADDAYDSKLLRHGVCRECKLDA